MSDPLSLNSVYECSQCGIRYPCDDIIEIEKTIVCFKCKPVYMQKIKEGVIQFKKKQRSVWWKIYFFIFLLLELINYNFYIKSILAKKNLLESMVGILVYPWVLIAVFGYAFNKKIFGRVVWKIMFPVALISDCILNYISFSKPDHAPELFTLILFFIIVTVPVSVFQYIAQYRYGYSKTEPWI